MATPPPPPPQSFGTLARQWGKLWGKGHEHFGSGLRRIISVEGSGATTYLQGLVTSDLLKAPSPPRDYVQLWQKGLDQVAGSHKPPAPAKVATEAEQPAEQQQDHQPPEPPVEFNPNFYGTCFLDHKGRIVTDAFLWKLEEGNRYLIDVPGDSADALMAHLQQYKLKRAKVALQDVTQNVSSHVVYGTYNSQGAPPGFHVAMDPRHPSLGMRVVSLEHKQAVFSNLMSDVFPSCPGTYDVLRKLGGIAQGAELLGKTALECNQEWLNAISFSKGCYLGQELTARTMHTGTIRKRILPILLVDATLQIPRPWVLASQVQEGRDEFLQGLANRSPLPSLSMPSVGGLMSVLTGHVGGDTEETEEMKQLKLQADLHTQALQDHAVPGATLVDAGGKTIGQLVSTPAAGTFCVLAQMRLDKTGLVEGDAWKRTNKVKVGDHEFRYLPYTPLWWPRVDKKTGKADESVFPETLLLEDVAGESNSV